MGYRWHWDQSQDSGFVGTNFGYFAGEGKASVNETSFTVDVTAIEFTINGGRRYAWKNGLNVTWRLGAGYASRTVEAQVDSEDAREAAELIQTLIDFLPVAVDAELSIGWVF